LPYLSQHEGKKLIFNAYNLLNNNGLIYLSFVEGNPEKSKFKTGAGGRVYFNYHQVDDIKAHLNEYMFVELKTIHVKYKISETEFEVHTILIAKKN
jgi:hypothetical protein